MAAWDFLNDYEGLGGYEEFRTQLVLMYLVMLNGSAQDLMILEMKPLEIQRFRLRTPALHAIQWLREILNREGKPFGTPAILQGANRLRFEWERS